MAMSDVRLDKGQGKNEIFDLFLFSSDYGMLWWVVERWRGKIDSGEEGEVVVLDWGKEDSDKQGEVRSESDWKGGGEH